MSARIHLKIKDANSFAKANSVSTMDQLLHPIRSQKKINAKAELLVCFDRGEVETLTASPKSYVMDVEPGFHEMAIADPTAQAKQGTAKTAFGVIGLITGIGSGINAGAVAAESGAQLAEAMFRDKDNVISFDLDDGDEVYIECQPTMTGKVKIKIR